jgi:DNA replication protein DnaC
MPAGFMLMVGPPGCGKTRLACNVVRELAAADALYVRQAELTFALRESYRNEGVVLQRSSFETSQDAGKTTIQIVSDVGFLVLDEMGRNALANDERLLLDETVKHRYERRKPTILISNLPLPSFRDFAGDVVTDRIVEATGNRKFLLQFTGGSFRRTAGGNYLAGLA